MKLRPFAVLLCLPALLSAQKLLNEQFAHGIGAWTVDSGKAFQTNGTLILRSIKAPEGGNQQGAVSFRLTGLTPGKNYELHADFRFERDFTNTWPWAMIAVYDASGASMIAEKRIHDRKQAGSGPDDSAWRTVSLPFNPGKATTVTIRLSNRTEMLDQTHWDNISVTPLDS